jgi:hypothetical protein
MTKRSIYRLAILLALCLAVAVVYFFFGDTLIGVFQRESFYGGKPAYYWVKSLNSQDQRAREAAVRALDQLGPESWLRALKDEDLFVSSRAKAYLIRDGSQLTPVIPVYIQALSDSNHDLRQWAVMALWGRVGPESKEVIPKLIETLKDEDRTIGMWAALDLGEGGPEAKSAVPAMIEALEDPASGADRHQVDRLWVITALGKIGPDAKPAVPALQRTLKDPNKHVAESAKTALEKIQSQETKQ